jgi:hypothetical protein
MAHLRQRHLNQANGNEKSEPLVSDDKCVVEPISSTRLSYRASIFLASVALSCVAFLLYAKRQQLPLSESYVLCSRIGNQIYTVDDTGSRVQCLAVHNSQIVATGSLGGSFFILKHCVTGLISSSDEVQEHWNNFDFTIQTTDTSRNVSYPPFLIRYLDEGSIVIPGMSGIPIPYSKCRIAANCNNQ